MKRLCAALLAAAAFSCVRRGEAAEPPPRPLRRLAVVVGANDPAPGRQPLRYAHADARLMADTLERVGRFAKQDVQTLLEPRPADLLAALDRAAREAQAAGGDSLLVFYYSGHSDGQKVFPHGEALALTDLRDRVARANARVRVAILDTCHGGGWTGTKGLSVGAPLDAADLMNVATEGTALLSSSSGLENAHEAAAVQGSFFTHHVAAGLLGAADKSGDGSVTLQEVFEYAQQRTVRDSARMAATAQHPSFDLQLRGRQDVALAQVASSPSALEVTQSNALEVIHLGSGVTVVETPAGQRRLRLALVPGRYLVRRVVEGRVYSKEVDVRPGAPASLDEGQLELTGDERLALKDAAARERPYSDHSTMARNFWELRFALGASTGERSFGSPLYAEREGDLERSVAGVWSLTYGITDRLSWLAPVPAFAYRFGEKGAFEVIPRFGLTSVGYVVGGGASAIVGAVDGGVAARRWVTPDLSLIASASADYNWQIKTAQTLSSPDGRVRDDVIALHAGLGLSWDVNEHVTLALGAGVSGSVVVDYKQEQLAEYESSNEFAHDVRSTAVLFGSVQSLGYRPLPLVQLHLSRKFSLDGYASIGVDLNGRRRDRYLAGFTWAF